MSIEIESPDHKLESFLICTFATTIKALTERMGITMEDAANLGIEYAKHITVEDLAKITIESADAHLNAGALLPSDFSLRDDAAAGFKPANRAQRRRAKFRRNR